MYKVAIFSYMCAGLALRKTIYCMQHRDVAKIIMGLLHGIVIQKKFELPKSLNCNKTSYTVENKDK